MNDDTIHIGTRDGWGQQIPFGIQIPELRHHVYVIGKTGSGKTTLLRNWIIQLIAAGHGVGFIDPHGDMAEELLNHIPSRRADHLVYFNPADLDFPVGLNLLANVPADERHLVASGIVGAFKSIWRESWGPRMEYILYNSDGGSKNPPRPREGPQGPAPALNLGTKSVAHYQETNRAAGLA
jgi:hypothetical protein